MLNINLNLPTLPTQDQKDAMDNASTPDATNVFITANDLTIPTLQEVSDEGNTTTNDIQLINDAEVIFGAGGGVLLDNASRLREGTIDAGFGGSKGIAQICAVGYELKWEAGRLYVMDGNGVLIRHSLHNFTTIPSANDDATKGYYVGSLWSLDSGVTYICTDSTTASATWDLYEAVPQVNADWNATSGVAEILNKPSIPDVSGFVPYTGANQNVNLGEYELKAGQLTLDVSPTGTPSVATTQWNNTIGSSETTLKGGNVLLKNGVDLVARIVNKVVPNTTLTKASYQAVKVSGATGGRLSVGLAQADVDLNSADTIGLVCETITTNQEGFILTVGQLLEINTTGSLQGETWADGDVLYLSPTTAGKLTNIKPTGATGHIVVIGYVEYAHAIHGAIYVKIINGWELDELHNVYINGVANKDLLAYESSTSLWKNKSASTLGIVETSDSRLTDTRTRKVAVQSNTDASTSATIAETVLKTLLVPTLVANTTLKIMSQVGKVGTSVNAVFKMYYNTTPDLSGSPVQIALLNFTATQVFAPFQRDITNKNSVTANSIYPATASSSTEIASTFPRTDLNVNLSGKYIVITGKAGTVADNVRVDNARLLIEE